MTQCSQNYPKSRKHLRKEILYSPQKLINLRRNRKLTRKDVSVEIGVSKDTLFNLETGRVFSPELNTLIALAEFYDCCIGEFLAKTQNSNYIHCSKTEYKLLKTIRQHPNLEVLNLIKFYENLSTKNLKIIDLTRNLLVNLPEEVIDDYIRLNEDLIKELKVKIVEEKYTDESPDFSRQLRLHINFE